MPKYTFEDPKTNTVYELDLPSDDLDDFIKEHPHLNQVFSINVADPVRIGVTKPPADFQKYVIGRMKESIHGNKINDSKFQIPKEI